MELWKMISCCQGRRSSEKVIKQISINCKHKESKKKTDSLLRSSPDRNSVQELGKQSTKHMLNLCISETMHVLTVYDYTGFTLLHREI